MMFEGFQVSVDYAAGVGVGLDGLTDLREDREEPWVGRRPVTPRSARSVAQRPALDEFHGEERPPVGCAAPNSYTGTMPGCWSLPGDLSLLDEPPDKLGRSLVLLQQELYRHVAAEVGITAPQDGAHATPGDLAEEQEAVGPVARARASRSSWGRDNVEAAAGRVSVPEEDQRQVPDRLREACEHGPAGRTGRGVSRPPSPSIRPAAGSRSRPTASPSRPALSRQNGQES